MNITLEFGLHDDVCTNCQKPRDQHVATKCLFAPTKYRPPATVALLEELQREQSEAELLITLPSGRKVKFTGLFLAGFNVGRSIEQVHPLGGATPAFLAGKSTVKVELKATALDDLK